MVRAIVPKRASCSEDDQLTHALPAPKPLEGGRQVGERDALGDELVEAKIARRVQVQEPWHVLVDPRRAEETALDRLLVDEPPGVDRDG